MVAKATTPSAKLTYHHGGALAPQTPRNAQTNSSGGRRDQANLKRSHVRHGCCTMPTAKSLALPSSCLATQRSWTFCKTLMAKLRDFTLPASRPAMCEAMLLKGT